MMQPDTKILPPVILFAQKEKPKADTSLLFSSTEPGLSLVQDVYV